MKNILKNAGVLLVSLALSFALAEIACRVFFHERVFHDRFLFVSRPWLVFNEAVRFDPDSHIREVAVYDGQVEYDITYHTDGLGLVRAPSVPDDPDPEYRIALIGDSFVAGSGYGDWVSELEERLRRRGIRARLYNLGIPGTGISHIEPLLASVASKVDFTHIFILPISDDAARPAWKPIWKKDKLYFLKNDLPERWLGRPMAYALEPSETGHMLSKRSAEIVRSSRAGGGNFLGSMPPRYPDWVGHSEFLKRLFLAFFYKGSAEPAQPEKINSTTLSLRIASIGILKQIRLAYPAVPMFLVQLPQKSEIRTSRYIFSMRNAAKSSGMAYFAPLEDTVWTTQDFYPRDSHPNARGYGKISSYVEATILRVIGAES